MNNKFKISILGLLIFSSISLRGQGTIVLQYYYTGAYPIHQPILSDSLSVNGKAFEEANLLKTHLSATDTWTNAKILNADTAGVITFDVPDNQYSLHLLKFYVNANQFVKEKLEVSGTGMFEVYVDGEKKKDKTKFDTAATSVSVELSLEAKRYEIVIKYLAPKAENHIPTVKAAFQSATEDGKTATTLNPQQRYTIEHIQDGKTIRSAAISPDGKYALVGYSERINAKTENYTQLIEAESGKILAQDKSYLSSAGWLPASGQLYYTRNGLKGKELVALNPAAMQETILANNLPEGSFSFTPDEKKLLFSIKEEGPKEQKSMNRIVDNSDRQKENRTRYSLAVYDLQTGLLQPLTFGYRNTHLNDISPDSRYVLFSSSNRDYTVRSFSSVNMYRVDLQTFQIDTIFSNELHISSARFSPDGKQLLVNASPDAFDGIGLNIGNEPIANSYDRQLFIYDLTAKQAKAITKDFNPSIKAAFWNKSDGKIYVLTDDKDCQTIYTIDPKTAQTSKIAVAEEVIKSFSVASKSPVLICYGQSASNADRLYFVNAKTMKIKCIYDLSAEKMQDIVLGKMHDFDFTSADGTTITGRYYLPPDFDSTKQYPLLVYYYGGTNPTSRLLEFSYSMHMYAAQGYVVYTLNPSGTTGFGQEFSARHVNAWGKRTADEIIQGTKLFYRTNSFIDSTKIGCFGASYGGFMTQYLQTQTDIFAAAVSHAGISSLASYWGEGYWGIGYCAAANTNSYPWNNHELFVGQSPLFQADKIKTPLLLLHGDDDTNVPVGESIQMFNALRILGRPVELIQVEGENHGIMDYHKRIAWVKTIMAWFDKWLKDQPQWWNEMYPDRNL
ncbi:MAG: prolyl oligopeptidase family serine peptidase [Lentimicrobiaceae bacterium]|nr:prolyl oligopeptidase family serine peptidase [Lentimicrobiaceae bacterium]